MKQTTNRTVIVLIMMMLTTMTAWATTETVSYIDADGNEQTVTATVLTGDVTADGLSTNAYGNILIPAGWYVVKNSKDGVDASYTAQLRYTGDNGTIHLILADGAEMTVSESNTTAINLYQDNPLAIYGQSGGTGRLTVTGYSKAINAQGGMTINGGIVNATATDTVSTAHAIDAYNWAITINGGQVTATTAGSGKGIYVYSAALTIGCRKASDFVSFNRYRGKVNIKSGQTLYAGATAYSGNNVSLPSGAVTLRPYSSDDFSVNDAGTEYTIKTAEGWNVFCDLLADNTKGYFDGKTVNLGADITVTRMAGGDNHDFTGTFDGGGHTLTFSHTATDNYCAPFRYVQGATAETPAVISNLNVVSTVTADDYRHPAGLIALQSGYVSVTDCNVEAHISNTKGTVNTSDLYPAALVSQSNNTGTLTVSGCTTTGQIATDGKYAAGLVGIVQNTATIENCRASVTIQSTTSGDGTHGGLVASQPSGTTITITGCVFDGSLLGSTTNSCGGFIGYRKGTATIYNSLFAPAEVTVQNDGSATFARNKVDTYNSYYTYYLCDGTNYAPYDPADADHPDKYNNGHATRTVAAAADVTIDGIALTGTATQYTVSGITAYSGGGLQLGETLYYGSGDQLSLTLSNSATGAPLGYRYDGYTASAGTLSGTTLTMPDQDVTISAALAPIDWATVNKGDSKYPYMIYNKDQLLLLAHRVNGTNGETANDYSGKYFKLGADITFDHDADEGDEYAENYEAIGGDYNSTDRWFKGDFDGDGHTVSGIRIRKDGTDDADSNQGLFGQINRGGNIHDVHLTDARIKGYYYVGGIVGFNFGTISGCTVTDSYITASEEYGTICGYDYGTLTNNYYHGCTVNGTAVTSGKGCGGSDITADNGALPAYRLTLGANITTPPGTFVNQTGWLAPPPVGARLAPENGFTLAGNHYFASGYEFTPGSTLASGAAQGYTPRATLGDVLLDLYTHTGDAPDYTGTAIARLTITADCDGKTLAAALRSDGLQHEVSYVDADGTKKTAQAIALDGTESSLGQYEQVTWYFVGADISHSGQIGSNGSVNIILTDGKTMSVVSNSQGFDVNSGSLTIYGQALGTGTLNATGTNYGIYASNIASITISGGRVTATGDNGNGISTNSGTITISGGTVTATSGNKGITTNSGNITIYGGTVNVTGTNHGITTNSGNITIYGGNITANGTDIGIYASNKASITISGGRVTATGSKGIYSRSGTITLGGHLTATDFIYVSSYGVGSDATLNIADGKTLYDEDGNSYNGTVYNYYDLDGATLRLYDCRLTLADNADNSAAISDADGKVYNVTLSGRTLYKDGAWNTLCLPFDVTDGNTEDKISFTGTPLEGADVMTLNSNDSGLTGSTLTLNFTDATGQTIAAGTPFIVKWGDKDEPSTLEGLTDLTAPVFTNVTVSNANNDVTSNDGTVSFKGTYASITYTEENKSILFVGGNNNLYWPTVGFSIGAQRAYFQLNDGQQARNIVLNFFDEQSGKAERDGENATGIHSTTNFTNLAGAWYTLDGRKLAGKPRAPGIYVKDGHKVAIKREK